MKYSIIAFIGILVVGFVLWQTGMVAPASVEEQEEPEVDATTLGSSEYGFTLEYPQTWESFETDEFEQRFNVYRAPIEAELPFDHFTNETNVSIFPEGIPTEGLTGRSVPIDFETGFAVAPESRMYVLASGEPFAAYLRPSNPPESWPEWGFIWARVNVTDLGSACLDRTGAEVGMQNCDFPIPEGFEVVQSGTTVAGEWDTVLEILASLEFTEY